MNNDAEQFEIFDNYERYMSRFKRDVVADIEAALIRGNSPVTLAEVMAALWSGRLTLCIGEHMTASCWDRDGPAEIVHLTGEWDNAEAEWMMGEFRTWAAERGKEPVFFGRKGWKRFLRRKGLMT